MNHQFSSDQIFEKYSNRTVSISIEKQDLLGKKRWIGSGFLISQKGYLLTCAHVLGDAQNQIIIRLGGSGKRYFGKVIASDPKNDITFIALDTEDKFDYFDLNPNQKATRGQIYYSISSPLGLEDSLTTGIVSDPERIGIDSILVDISYLQVNQSILPGSSGAAIFDKDGNLLGMSQFQIKNPDYNQQSIGFAILPKHLYDFVNSIELTKLSKLEVQRGIVEVPIITDFLMQTLKLPSKQGVLISHLVEKSPAEIAGLQRYDFIISIDDQKIRSIEEMNTILKNTSKSERLQIKIIRNRSEKVLYINP